MRMLKWLYRASLSLRTSKRTFVSIEEDGLESPENCVPRPSQTQMLNHHIYICYYVLERFSRTPAYA